MMSCSSFSYSNTRGVTLVIVDDYSRFTWVFFLQEKSQTQDTLKGFLRQAQNEFGLRIKKIRSDNGTEFKNSQIEGFLEDEGIKHEFSSPYTPQQNGVVERKIELYWTWQEPCLMSTRHRTGFGRKQSTLLATPSTGSTFTESSRKHRMNFSLVKSPMFHILVFGSKCFIFVKRGRKSKSAPKDVEGFLLGSDSNTRAYRVFNKSTG
jgi:transposase InsO family protein